MLWRILQSIWNFVYLIVYVCQIGKEFYLIGIAFFAVYFILAYCLAKKIRTISRENLQIKDEETAFLKKAVHNLNLIAKIAWEDNFLNKFNKLFGKEQETLRKLQLWTNLLMIYAQIVPNLILMLFLFIDCLKGEEISNKSIISSLTLFYLDNSITSSPNAINFLLELQVSKSRITQNFSMDSQIIANSQDEEHLLTEDENSTRAPSCSEMTISLIFKGKRCDLSFKNGDFIVIVGAYYFFWINSQ